MKITERKNNKGFTLVETLVAIGILSVAILGTFTAVQSGLQNSYTAKDRTVAFWLAQEGMEYIKNIRDQNALSSVSGNPTNWMAGLTSVPADPCFFGKTCIIDSYFKTVSTCPGGFGSCPVINIANGSGIYTYNLGVDNTPTTFLREIQFTSISADEVLVIIKMSWITRGMNFSFTVTQSLFNRQ